MSLENDKHPSISVLLLKDIWLSETYLNLDSAPTVTEEPVINKICSIFGFDAHQIHWNNIISDNSLTPGTFY